jgi:transposase InsO family protein
MEEKVIELSLKYPTLGYKKVSKKLRDLGYKISKQLVQRIRRDEFLQISSHRKKAVRKSCSTGLPTKASYRNHMWAWDFVSDWTVRGGKLRAFNLIDEYTRECHCIYADRSLKSKDVLDCLDEAIKVNGSPEYIRSDNGSEFIAKIVKDYLHKKAIKTIYIEPGCPWQNGFAESFNGRFREECLNREVFYGLKEAQVIFDDWRRFYNEERPHSSLGLLTPKEFATRATPRGGKHNIQLTNKQQIQQH